MGVAPGTPSSSFQSSSLSVAQLRGANLMGTDGTRPVPPGVDISLPSAGRMYDRWLNGTEWYDVDREAALRLEEKVPEILYLAQANRRFVQVGAGVMARAGIRQFIDVGSGIPTQFNTHQVAHLINPGAAVVYVDNDPEVLFHGTHLLQQWGETQVIMLEGDVREPGSILDSPKVRHLIDFNEPVGMMLCSILHFVSDENDPWQLVRDYMAPCASGSYLALSHGTFEGQRPDKVQRFNDVYSGASAQLYQCTFAEIDRMFTEAGLEYLPPYDGAEPSLSYVDKWGSRNPDMVDPSHSWVPAGVAVKP
jgi:hypothetical protein